MTTRRCTAACDHCAVGAHPRAAGAIPVTRLHGLIDEAVRVGTFGELTFTGGEPFLLKDDLVALVRRAHGYAFKTRIISNAYWAVNDEAATALISALRDAGLDERRTFSTGTFHQRFVPVERVVTAARASIAHGVRTHVSVEDCDQSDFSSSSLAAELKSESATGLLRIVAIRGSMAAGGRGDER